MQMCLTQTGHTRRQLSLEHVLQAYCLRSQCRCEQPPIGPCTTANKQGAFRHECTEGFWRRHHPRHDFAYGRALSAIEGSVDLTSTGLQYRTDGTIPLCYKGDQRLKGATTDQLFPCSHGQPLGSSQSYA